MRKIKVGILGAAGYTGAELLRLLAVHGSVEVAVLASRSLAGQRVADVFPNLRGHYDHQFIEPTSNSFSACDVVFSATPNGVAMNYARELLAQDTRLIDLAADFRLSDVSTWEKWYEQQHACPDLLEHAVYGLPELNREAIKDASIVANPGCYPTATTLALIPLLENDLVESTGVIADTKSGVTGAGRGANVANLFAEVSDSFKAYAASAHRHHPEISQTLAAVAGRAVDLTFVPHLLPILRGIHATIYADLKANISLQQVQQAFAQRYENEPFVDVMPAGSHPQTRAVKGSNYCQIALHEAAGSGKLVVLSAIDNLTKGAAGQAIQNMNIMFDLNEATGLTAPGLLP